MGHSTTYGSLRYSCPQKRIYFIAKIGRVDRVISKKGFLPTLADLFIFEESSMVLPLSPMNPRSPLEDLCIQHIILVKIFVFIAYF